VEIYQRFKSTFALEVRTKTDPEAFDTSCSVASFQNTSPETPLLPDLLMFTERFLFLPLGSTTVLSWLIRGLKIDVWRRSEPSYAGLRETDTPALEVLPTNVSIESGGAAGNLMSIGPLLVPVVTSNAPPVPFSEIKLILESMALKWIKEIKFYDCESASEYILITCAHNKFGLGSTCARKSDIRLYSSVARC
jgi:hypothetical protein